MADLTATLFCLLGIVQTCSTAQLTINPPSLILSGNSSVRITCQPDMTVSPQDLLYSLWIRREATGSTAQPTLLGSASQMHNNNGAARMDTVITGATIEGSLSQQSITITMTQVTCTDEVTFVCIAAIFDGEGAASPTFTVDRKNVTVDVPAGSVSMIQEPLLPTYQVNVTLIMRCNGLVGRNKPAVKIEWVWQYKDNQGFMWNNYGRTEDIVHDSIVPDTTPCQNRQTSTLTRQITMDDTRREYRCFVRRNGLPSEPDSQHSATYLVGVFHGEQPPLFVARTSTANKKQEATALSVVQENTTPKNPVSVAGTSTANETQDATTLIVDQEETTPKNPVSVAANTYCQLKQHEVGLQSPYAELNPYTEPSYRDATSHRQI